MHIVISRLLTKSSTKKLVKKKPPDGFLQKADQKNNEQLEWDVAGGGPFHDRITHNIAVMRPS